MKKAYKVKTTGGIEERLGVDLPAFENMGLYLFIYRYEEDRKKVWYIVDKRTGLSVMKAHTRKEALERFYNWTKEPKNVDRLKSLITKTVEKDGEVNHVSIDSLQ